MIPTIQILVLLLSAATAVAVLAVRLKIPPAIILVLSGVVLALVPGLLVVELAPELVLLLLLPPIIYASAVAMSWGELRFNLRSLSALGCVLFTTVAVPRQPIG
jgi:monovalent cation/hydrogen antiporter